MKRSVKRCCRPGIRAAASILKKGLLRHQNMADAKKFSVALANAETPGQTILQPRAGVALLREHIQLLSDLSPYCDVLPTTVDAYTRHNRYEEAQKGIEKSRAAGTSLLNGFPPVNHGVDGCERLIDSLSKPVQVRHGTPDARLMAEITLAAGFSSFEGGGISYNIPYAKNVRSRNLSAIGNIATGSWDLMKRKASVSIASLSAR